MANKYTCGSTEQEQDSRTMRGSTCCLSLQSCEGQPVVCGPKALRKRGRGGKEEGKPRVTTKRATITGEIKLSDARPRSRIEASEHQALAWWVYPCAQGP